MGPIVLGIAIYLTSWEWHDDPTINSSTPSKAAVQGEPNQYFRASRLHFNLLSAIERVLWRHSAHLHNRVGGRRACRDDAFHPTMFKYPQDGASGEASGQAGEAATIMVYCSRPEV